MSSIVSAATAQTKIPTRDARLRIDLFNKAVTANTNILTPGISANTVPLSYFVIYCTFVGTGTLSVMRTVGATTVAEQMNAGVPLVVNAAYSFSFPVSALDTINLQYSISTTMLKLSIIEILEDKP